MPDLRVVTREREVPAEPADCRLALRKVMRVLLVVAGLGLAIALIMWCSGSRGRMIRTLPEAERVGLFERTMQNLKTVCAYGATSMRDFCEEQARLAEDFPECDLACHILADKQLSRVQSPR